VIVNGAKTAYILDLAELAKYYGKEILNVSDSVIAQILKLFSYTVLKTRFGGFLVCLNRLSYGKS